MDVTARYVRSRDGSTIAYAVRGEGPVLLHLQVPSLSHIELYPRLPGAQTYLERLGRGRTVIEMDFRGTGMSQRDYDDHSAEGLTDDIEAVLDHLKIDRFDIAAGGARVTPALGIASRRPGAVGKIVLGYPFNVRPQPIGPDEKPTLTGLMESNWDLFIETTTQRNTGLPISQLDETLAFVRRCFDQHNAVATMRAWRPEVDWALAAHIDLPVLVLEFLGNVHTPAGMMESFANQFPQGRYMRLPETSMPPPYGDAELTLQAIHEFLGPALGNEGAVRDPLSAREREVLTLLAHGRTQPEIAESLVISPSTVSRHVVSLYAKLGVHRRAEAVAWAIHHGLA